MFTLRDAAWFLYGLFAGAFLAYQIFQAWQQDLRHHGMDRKDSFFGRIVREPGKGRRPGKADFHDDWYSRN